MILLISSCDLSHSTEQHYVGIKYFPIFKGMKSEDISILFHLHDKKYELNEAGAKKCQDFIDYASRDGKESLVDNYILIHYDTTRTKDNKVPRKIMAIAMVCERYLGKDNYCLSQMKNKYIADGLTNKAADAATKLYSSIGGCSITETIGQPVLIDTRDVGQGEFID